MKILRQRESHCLIAPYVARRVAACNENLVAHVVTVMVRCYKAS